MTFPQKKHITLLAFYAILFLISGFAGLVYQVVWERLLQIFFGVTTVSITLIVAAYMAGLGLGSLIGGRLSQKVRSVLIAYGVIEIGIGAFGLISPGLLLWVGRATAGSNYLLVFVLSFVLLIIPTFLMGMTLPLLTQGFVRKLEVSGRVVGLLYGINTLGAAIGALITGFVLIGWLGLSGTTTMAFFMNAGIGMIAIWLAKVQKKDKEPLPTENMTVELSKSGWRYTTILTASFLTGFLGLGYEMVWVRVIGILNKNTAYNFPTILFVFLIGLALGGYFWGSRADKTDARSLFWKVEIAGGLAAAGSLLLLWIALDFEPVSSWVYVNFLQFQNPPSPYVLIDNSTYIIGKRLVIQLLLQYFIIPAVVILPPALILGGGLPILDRIAIESTEVAGRRVGDVHLANIAGSVLGTMTISFLFLRYFGSEWTLRILLLISLAFPVLYLVEKTRLTRKWDLEKQIGSAIAAVFILAMVFPQTGSLYGRLYETGTQRSAITLEGSDTVLALTMNSLGDEPEWMWIGGELNSFYPPNGDYEGRAITCGGAAQPHRILIIGFGGGVSSYFYTFLPGVEEIVIVELMEDIGPFLRENLPLVEAILADSRVQYVADDGRRWLYANPDELFDLISLDPLRSATTGHDNLYSIEAMELYREHLNEDGILCTWVDENHRIPATTAQVFPYVDDYQEHMIASNTPISYDLAYMESSSQSYLSGAADIIALSTQERIDPINVLSLFWRDQEQILISEAGIMPITDLHPRVEYYFFTPPIYGIPSTGSDRWSLFYERIIGCDLDCRNHISPN